VEKRSAKRGYSKDHRPDLVQMILGVVVDAEGSPVCSEMGPGNTADAGALVPVIDRLRSRFAIGRVCVVADRGMRSAPTIAALEERGLEYVLGARERSDTLVRQVVLADGRRFTPLCIPRAAGKETQLWVPALGPSSGSQLWVPALGQGGHRRGPALRGLPQRGRGGEGCRRPPGGGRGPRPPTQARRQGSAATRR
jgi:hypothetical protein